MPKIANFAYPTVIQHPDQGTPQNFGMKLALENLEGWGYCMVKIASTVFDCSR